MNTRLRQFMDNRIDKDSLTSLGHEIDNIDDFEIDSIINTNGYNHDFTDDDVSKLRARLNDEIMIQDKSKRVIRIVLKIAAVLLPFVLISYLFINYTNYTENKYGIYDEILSQDIKIETQKGQRVETILPDGTHIVLNPDSRLTYSLLSFNQRGRKISYSGSGFFSVEKYHGSSFTIVTDSYEIEVLGTEFSIYENEIHNTAEIHLESGSIKLTALKTNENLTLSPGETVLVNNETGDMSYLDDGGRHTYSLGKGFLNYTSCSVYDIINDLELYYGVAFELDNNVGEIIFTGSLPCDNLPQALYTLEETLDVTIKQTDDSVVVTHK